MEIESVNQNSIENWAVSSQVWRESARGVMTDGWDTQETIEFLANYLINQVMTTKISLNELRAGVAWASALDAEATEKQSASLNEGDYRFERTARRIMHHAGRTALEKVKNRHKRLVLQIGYSKKSLLEVE